MTQGIQNTLGKTFFLWRGSSKWHLQDIYKINTIKGISVDVIPSKVATSLGHPLVVKSWTQYFLVLADDQLMAIKTPRHLPQRHGPECIHLSAFGSCLPEPPGGGLVPYPQAITAARFPTLASRRASTTSWKPPCTAKCKAEEVSSPMISSIQTIFRIFFFVSFFCWFHFKE